MSKRNIAFISSFEVRDTARSCEWPGCRGKGRHPAPRQEAKIVSILKYAKQAHWFCAEHIRDYNRSWNFFSGMSEAEITRFNHDALTGHRPTWKRPHVPCNAEVLRRHALRFRRGAEHFGGTYPPLPEKERKALETLSLGYPVTRAGIKSRYRELVKRLHPDRHKGDGGTLERLKAINLAYHALKHSSCFPA